MDIKKFFKNLGPGIITGVADDDPSGIATYSQTGAQFGYGMLWMALFMLPLQTAIQESCARIGAVTGKGLAAVIKEKYSKTLLYCMVSLLVIANVINIGADLGAMAQAVQLIIPIHAALLTISFTIGILLLEVLCSYRSYANFLKWLCLFILAYPITVILIDIPWQTVIKATVLPHIELNLEFIFILTGVLGTTISPYLFFWQASEVVEEIHGQKSKTNRLPVSASFIRNLRIDNFLGMFFSEIGTWSIIVVTATVLNTQGITDIKTAADAAKALEPLVHSFPNAGLISKLIFAIGIIGLGLLAIPVLAGSTAYALSEAGGWKTGLNLKFSEAKGFYAIIISATNVGLFMNYIGIDPIKALIIAAVINGVIAVPLIFIIAMIASDEVIMGRYKSGKLSKVCVWLAFVSMGTAAGAMLLLNF